ncbi:response regulator transcription factor [Bacillus subtilis]|nr:response regulator transcription factor [Bacillus subtilis]MDM5300295.1 response regulator transcription factor [Bacillus subtilis]MDM5322348.1 response regulator transcription factor [Bacillus subtilis]
MDEKILIVDDEKGLTEMIKILFEKNGLSNLYIATSGKEALKQMELVRFNLVILDIMLPDIDGFELCRIIRKDNHIPILFLTARTTDLDLITGLSIGGDDYIKKPFNPMEVLARVKALLRRQNYFIEEKNSMETKGVMDFGSFQLNKKKAILIVNGREVNCPLKEFELLEFFCKNPNQVFSVEQLYDRVWGDGHLGNDNTVMVHIRRLREKIETNPSKPKKILNVRGFGYKFIPS